MKKSANSCPDNQNPGIFTTRKSGGFVRSGIAGWVATLGVLIVALPAISALQGNTTVGDVSSDENRTRSAAIGDLNGDGFPDLVVANESAQRNQIYFGDGLGGFGAAVDLDNRQEVTDSVDLADVDNDGDLDLVIGNRSTTQDNRLYTNNGSGIFQARNTAVNDSTFTSRQTSSVRFADLNQDGDPDIVVANRNSRNVVLLGNPAAGVFGFPTNDDLANSGQTDSSSVAVGDLNGDGVPEIVVANRQNARNDLYINNGGAGVPFGNRLDLSNDENYTDWIEIADLNNDGANDVIFGNRMQPNLFLLNQDTGATIPQFDQSRHISSDVDYTRDIRAVDVDGDGDLDIVTANDSSSTNKLYLNQFIESGMTAVSFADGISISGNATESITIAVCSGTCDLDGDGDTDFVFGNNGAPTGTDGAVNRAYINNNEDPIFVSDGVEGAQDGEVYTYDIVADDLDLGQTLTFSTPTLPAWLGAGFTDNGDRTATLTATPGTLDVGAHPVSLMVSDGNLTATQDFVITVSALGTNAAPMISSTPGASPVAFAQTGDGTYTYDITTSDANDAPNSLVIFGTELPSWASVTDFMDGTAQLAGVPQQSDLGSHAVTVRVTDPGGRIDEQSFVIAVSDGNDRPIAIDDDILIGQGETATALAPNDPHHGATSVLYNDFDIDGDTLVVDTTPVNSVANGILTLNADGTFEYINDGLGGATDSFRYRVRDGNGRANIGDVSIVIGTNAPPTATDDVANVERGMALIGASVLVNDDDPDGNNASLVATLVTGPANAVAASFVLNSDGSYSYTHDGSATITDTFTYTADDPLGGVSNIATVTITIDDDATVPTISVDPVAVNVAFGSVWDDAAARAGVTATDNIDGDITANVVVGGDTVDTNTADVYDVTYDVSDSTGNPAVQATRTVTVDAAPDTTPPVITLLGNASVTVTVGSSYTDAGATAMDNVDGDLSAGIVVNNPVDTNTVDTYTVTYNVSDAAGNPAAEVDRTVNVIAADSTAPVITLLGNASVTVTVGSSYTDAGATATDNVDGDLSSSIVVSNPVDTNTIATYAVTYNVSDAAGNAATEVSRTVTVEAATPPPPPPRSSGGGGSVSIPGALGLLLFLVVMSARKRWLVGRSI